MRMQSGLLRSLFHNSSKFCTTRNNLTRVWDFGEAGLVEGVDTEMSCEIDQSRSQGVLLTRLAAARTHLQHTTLGLKRLGEIQRSTSKINSI